MKRGCFFAENMFYNIKNIVILFVYWYIIIYLCDVESVKLKIMKYSEFLKFSKKNGWMFLRQGKGSHEIWEKDGKTVSIPNHGTKEMPKGLERSLKKEMGM